MDYNQMEGTKWYGSCAIAVQIGFFSRAQGLLACFGLWGHAVLEYDQETFRIPLNFWDLDQAWEQVIFEKGEYVYILEGDADDHTCGYHCWFHVSKERYLAEWQLALEACRQIIRDYSPT